MTAFHILGKIHYSRRHQVTYWNFLHIQEAVILNHMLNCPYTGTKLHYIKNSSNPTQEEVSGHCFAYHVLGIKITTGHVVPRFKIITNTFSKTSFMYALGGKLVFTWLIQLLKSCHDQQTTVHKPKVTHSFCQTCPQL